jgi:photosystem II stability/assembly factor-like uncharacterized protein
MGLAWVLLFSWMPAHAQDEWTRLDGPVLPGGPVMGVAASSAQSNTLYALVDHPFGVRLFRSQADTISWTQVVTLSTEISPTEISTLFVDPGDGQVLYANNGSATLRSQDGGLSWTEILTAAGPIAVPAASTVFVLHRIENTENGDCSYNRVLAGSDDAGSSWRAINVPCLGEKGGLAVAPSDPQIIYLTSATGFNTLYRSTDGGQTWEGNRTLPPTARIVINPTDDKHLLASGFGDMRQSYDAGESWASISLRPFRVFLEASETHFASDGTIYIGAHVFTGIDLDNTAPVIYRSEDKGKTWWLATELLPEFGMKLLVSPADPSTLLSWSLSRGVLRSPDQGNGWQEANDGIRSPVLIETIEADSAGSLYVGASRFNQARNGLFRSDDKGVTWRTILTDTQIQRVVTAPGADLVIAISNGKLYQGGTLLSERMELASVGTLDVDISVIDPNRRLLVGYRRYLDEGVVGIWYPGSADGGIPGWGLSAVEGSRLVTAALIDPAQPTRMYIAAVMTGTKTAILRSEDGGFHWQEIARPVSEHGVPYQISRFYAVDGRIYATGFGIFYSDDDGESWHTISSRAGRTFFGSGTHLAVSNDGQIFIAAEDGAYRWHPFLDAWERLDLPNGAAYAVAIDKTGDAETLYVSNAQGIWKRTIPTAPDDEIWLPLIGR